MKIRVTQEIFEDRIKKRFPSENFKIINYINSNQPLTIQCLKCKQIIQVSVASNFLEKNKAYGCKNCNGLWREREKKLAALQEKYDIIQTYVKDTHTYYVCRCKKCGRERNTTLNNYLDSHCYCEGGFRQWTEEEWTTWLKEEYDDEYKLISPFKKVTEKVSLQHIPCGFIWSVRPSDVNSGATCPKCGRIESKGVRTIKKVLDQMNINYEREYPVGDTKQRFDFYFSFGGKEYAIEYNGIQHYEYVPFFHRNGESDLAVQKDRDARKQEYCKNNNINLIIIPYNYTTQEIKNFIHNLFNSTTSHFDVASSEAKQCPSSGEDEDIV